MQKVVNDQYKVLFEEEKILKDYARKSISECFWRRQAKKQNNMENNTEKNISEKANQKRKNT